MAENWQKLLGQAYSKALNLKQASDLYEESDEGIKGRRIFMGYISDTDRYNLDRYDVHVALSPNVGGYSVGVHISNAQVGVAGYLEYWHYKDKKEANNTFNVLVKICKKMIEEVGYERPPMTTIVYTLRSALANIDPGHKEKTGIPMINEYLAHTEKASDPRELLYGNRYPVATPEIMNRSYSDVDTEGTQEVEIKGKNSRHRQYSIKRQASTENNPIKPDTKKLRDKKPPEKLVDIPDTNQTKVVTCSSSFHESKNILKDIMKIHEKSLNLNPHKMNRFWNAIIAPQLRAKDVPHEHMASLQSVFMNRLIHRASDSSRYKISFKSIDA